ncbi:hypothetical protein [Ferrimonas marina]|uniref:Uncharacterized protein n=1 Tax=Ferrimonas marina TaxID=299255 RepID=A0A1M5P7S6_9GAMM|nr:hypothetical protein [Ferrimonas marina]SHG97747.1 hypothetical protein SAMN02745129_1319 [Ferrimonas marina]
MSLLLLTACSSETETLEPRQVRLTATGSELAASQSDYQPHRGRILSGYQLQVADAKGERTLEGINLNQGVELTLYGAADLSLSHPEFRELQAPSSHYALQGEVRVGQYDTAFEIEMHNRRWGMVAVQADEAQSDLPTLDDQPLQAEPEFQWLYAPESSVPYLLVVPTYKGIVYADHSPKAGHLQRYILEIDDTQGVIKLKDEWVMDDPESLRPGTELDQLIEKYGLNAEATQALCRQDTAQCRVHRSELEQDELVLLWQSEDADHAIGLAFGEAQQPGQPRLYVASQGERASQAWLHTQHAKPMLAVHRQADQETLWLDDGSVAAAEFAQQCVDSPFCRLKMGSDNIEIAEPMAAVKQYLSTL